MIPRDDRYFSTELTEHAQLIVLETTIDAGNGQLTIGIENTRFLACDGLRFSAFGDNLYALRLVFMLIGSKHEC